MKPIVTEKAIMILEKDNTIIFEVERRMNKIEAKEKFEKLFDMKVAGVRTQIKRNKKYVHIKLKKEFPAIDLATKLGMI